MMYSIAISPRSHIGYCFVVEADNPQHALSILSYDIRQCLKAGVDSEKQYQSNNLLETLKVIRKWWRLTFTPTKYNLKNNWVRHKVEIIPVRSMKVSYDSPLIPWYWNEQYKERGEAFLSGTSNHHDLKLELVARRKPHSEVRNQGPNRIE